MIGRVEIAENCSKMWGLGGAGHGVPIRIQISGEILNHEIKKYKVLPEKSRILGQAVTTFRGRDGRHLPTTEWCSVESCL